MAETPEGSDATVPPPSGRTAWPYTTPTGHTYERPRTLRDVAARHTDAAQGTIEHWDEGEMPPDPEWEFLGPLWGEINRLRKRCSRLATFVRAYDDMEAAAKSANHLDEIQTESDALHVARQGLAYHGIVPNHREVDDA